MLSRAVQLHPRIAPFGAALSAYRAGRFDECLDALLEYRTPAAYALAARTLTRLGRVQEAFDACERIDPASVSCIARGELFVLKAHAALRLGRAEEAERHLLDARVAACSSYSLALEADYELAEANFHFAARDVAATFSAVERSLTVGLTLPARMNGPEEYFVPPGIVRAKALDLRGLLARTADGLLSQLEWARLAFSALDEHPGADQWLSSVLLSNFASVAFELGDPELGVELEQRVAAIDWTSSMAFPHFTVVRASGWLNALAGDYLGAFRQFRQSTELAPSRAWKIESVLERSFLARELGQGSVAEDELKYAIELARDAEARSSADPFPAFTALVKLAELVARYDAAEARAILDRYRAARAKCPAIFFSATDRAWRAKELIAEGAVARSEGRTETAVDLFVNAFDAYDKLGSRWQAALIALELAEMTEQPFFMGYASREAQRRPHSWLAQRVAALCARPG